MPNYVLQSTVLVANGAVSVAPGAAITVRAETSGAVVPLWLDKEGVSAAGNPVLADDVGFFRAYCEPGEYRVTIDAQGRTQTLPHVVVGGGMPGPAGPAGGKGDTGDTGAPAVFLPGPFDEVGDLPEEGALGQAAVVGGTVYSWLESGDPPVGAWVAAFTLPTGPQGDPGAGIAIAGSVATYAALPGGLGPGDAGDAYFVTADGKLYIWDGSAFPSIGSGVEFRGPPGSPGYLANDTELWDRATRRDGSNISNAAGFRSALGVPQGQTAPDDTTAGRAMVNGRAFGLGAANPTALSGAGAADAISVTSWHKVAAEDAVAAGFPWASAFNLHTRAFNSTYAVQDAVSMSPSTLGRRITRTRSAGAWGAWRHDSEWITPEDFGAVGNGIADDTAALKAAFAAGDNIRFRPGAVYLTTNSNLTDGVVTVGRSIRLDGQGATIHHIGTGSALRFVGEWSATNDVSAITYNDGSIDDDETPFYTDLTVSGSTAAYVRGAVVKIGSAQGLPAATALGRMGEWATVHGVVDGKVRIWGRLHYNYDTGQSVKIGVLREHSVVVRDLKFRTTIGLGNEYAPAALLRIDGINGGIFENVAPNHIYDRMVRCADSVGLRFVNNKCMAGGDHNAMASDYASGTRGYVISSYGCYGTVIENLVIANTRHGVTFSAASANQAPFNTGMSGYGADEYGEVRGGQAMNCTSAPWQTHHGCRGTKFIGCVSKSSRSTGFTARGVGVEFINCTSDGDRDGFSFYVQHATSMTVGCKALGCTILNPRRSAFQSGSGDYSPLDATMKGCVIEFRGGAHYGLGAPEPNPCWALWQILGTETVNISDATVLIRSTEFSTLDEIIRDSNGAGSLRIDGMVLDISGGEDTLPDNAALYRKTGGGTPDLRINNLRVRVASGVTLTTLVHGAFATTSRFSDIQLSGITTFSSALTIQQLQAGGYIAEGVWIGGVYVEPRPITNVASAPTALRQIATVDGQAYISVGTSSAADWKQIT